MQIIYSYIEPWVIYQNVYVMTDGINPVMTDKIAIDDLPVYLSTEYANHNCDKIILHGSTKLMTEQIAEDIVTYGNTNFGLNDINIEVIK